MTGRPSWDMLYERQPLGLDAILLAVALTLHAPLLTLHIKGTPKAAKGKSVSRLVNIDYIEQKIQQRKEKPMVLPPKVEAPKKIQEMVKKVEDVKQAFKRSLPPPPPPKPKAQNTITQGPQPTKLQESLLKQKLENKPAIQDKGAFQGRSTLAGGPAAGGQLKIGGTGSAIQAGGLSSVGGPQGGALKGKSGFQMASSALPASIGGDEGGGLKTGGAANIVVVPVGARARADSSILSPVAKKDKGPLLTPGTPGAAPTPSAAGGLSGAGGGASIAIGGGSRIATPAPGAAGQRTDKKLENKALPSPAEPARTLPPAPGLGVLPRRTMPKVQKPLFLITGPLADRAVAFREVPAYPEWARERGIEAAVVLQFTVTPDGRVKDNVLVVRTSGYPALDEVASGALKQWKFAPLPSDRYQEQVGTITFNFSVR